MYVLKTDSGGRFRLGNLVQHEEVAVQPANSTDYGMISAVCTQDLSRAHRLVPALRSAQVYVNSYGAGGGVELPYGGYKRSGYGREKGVEGLIEYSQPKTVLINYTTGRA